jgi:hypothetical protein
VHRPVGELWLFWWVLDFFHNPYLVIGPLYWGALDQKSCVFDDICLIVVQAKDKRSDRDSGPLSTFLFVKKSSRDTRDSFRSKDIGENMGENKVP